jgi:ABC-2 type transport system permease protein
MKKFNAIVKARTMEFVRDRGTFFWNLLFPVLLVFGFAFAFSGDNQTFFKVGLIGQTTETPEFLSLDELEYINYTEDKESVLDKLRQHQLDIVIDLDESSYYINEEAASAGLVRRLLNTDPWGAGLSERQVSGEAIRYVDWFVPGVIGMNMMFSCLFGVGFVIVRYRKNGVLKRLKATPVSALSFISAQAVSRLVIVLITSVFVFIGTNFFLGFVMKGSFLNLLLVALLGVLCLISMGLVFASRIKSEELASGLINLFTFPMMLLSGIFFSLEGTPAIVQNISKIFPLTHFVDAARNIMLEGAGLLEILPNLTVLAALTGFFLLLSSMMFRWE